MDLLGVAKRAVLGEDQKTILAWNWGSLCLELEFLTQLIAIFHQNFAWGDDFGDFFCLGTCLGLVCWISGGLQRRVTASLCCWPRSSTGRVRTVYDIWMILE